MQSAGFDYRSLIISDLPDIQEMYQLLTAESENPMIALSENQTTVRWHLRKIRQQLIIEERYVAVLALAAGEKVGYCAGYVDPLGAVFRASERASISELYVRGEYRRQGVGETLLREVVQRFARRGIEWVELTVPENSKAARKIAQRNGFGMTSHVMHQRLN